MEMLREWNGDTLKPLINMFEQFGVVTNKLSLLKYEALTPDSFIWVINSGGRRYCLYAEDYVPSLQHVSEMMKRYGVLSGESDDFQLLPVKKPSQWAQSSPVTSADVYDSPANKDEFMKFAMPSGHDFVFLGASIAV